MAAAGKSFDRIPALCGDDGGGGNRTRVTSNPESADLQGKSLRRVLPDGRAEHCDTPRLNEYPGPDFLADLPSRRRYQRQGLIYLLQEGEDGPVKIGFSYGTLFTRVCELQTGNPRKLNVLASFSGSLSDESELHLRFAGHHIFGEWFSPAVLELSPFREVLALAHARFAAVPEPRHEGAA